MKSECLQQQQWNGIIRHQIETSTWISKFGVFCNNAYLVMYLFEPKYWVFNRIFAFFCEIFNQKSIVWNSKIARASTGFWSKINFHILFNFQIGFGVVYQKCTLTQCLLCDKHISELYNKPIIVWTKILFINPNHKPMRIGNCLELFYSFLVRFFLNDHSSIEKNPV